MPTLHIRVLNTLVPKSLEPNLLISQRTFHGSQRMLCPLLLVWLLEARPSNGYNSGAFGNLYGTLTFQIRLKALHGVQTAIYFQPKVWGLWTGSRKQWAPILEMSELEKYGQPLEFWLTQLGYTLMSSLIFYGI